MDCKIENTIIYALILKQPEKKMLENDFKNIDVGVILKDMSKTINNLFAGLIGLRSTVRHLIERNVLTYEDLQQKIENIEQRLEKNPDYNNRICINKEICIEENHYFGNSNLGSRLMKMEKITPTYVIFSEKDSDALGAGKTIKMSIKDFKEKFNAT